MGGRIILTFLRHLFIKNVFSLRFTNQWRNSCTFFEDYVCLAVHICVLQCQSIPATGILPCDVTYTWTYTEESSW